MPQFSLIACLLAIIFGCILPDLPAQPYLTPQFDRTTTQTFTYAITNGDTLYLDLYRPEADTTTTRQKPLLLYVHGGGFSGGRRNEESLVAFAHDLARRGYAVASISYRLTMRGQSFSCDQPTPNKIRTFQAAVQDIRAATQFILDRRVEWGIDPARIVLAGSSAGAEAVLHAAYWSLDRLPEGTVALPEHFRYAGVLSMAGALVDLRLITDSTAIPTLLFHGTCDNLVPYATAAHHYCQPGDPGYLMLHGGRSIAGRLEALGKPYYLFTSCHGDHSWAGRPLAEQQETIVDFLFHDVLQNTFRQIHEVVRDKGGCDYFEAEWGECR